MDAKGRRGVGRATGDRHWSRKYPHLVPRGDANGSRKHPERLKRGVDNNHAKLTESDVRQIREMSAAGRDNASIARSFGVYRSTVRNIVIGKTWRHVDGGQHGASH